MQQSSLLKTDETDAAVCSLFLLIKTCLDQVHSDFFLRKMGTLMIKSPFCPHRKVPDHLILCGGPKNRYWVMNVEERPGLKTLTISCSKLLHPAETCLLRDGW